ncbi:MAG: hypothetical protein HDT44_11370 [Ruminococcaceae bacterium]|nr:hypothetical protein [Oscillospiraceae bacterium]
MKICIINGSPKANNSTSELLIGYLMPFIKENEIITYRISKRDFSEIQFSQIQNSEALIFAFPLYIDSIDSHLLRFLLELEKRGFENKNISVYCIINNGFYEGRQNQTAADIMKNWCEAVGLTYGQTLGVGAGEMLPFLKDIPLGHGPNKNIGIAFQKLSRNILSLSQGKDLFVSPNWPRFLWKIQSSLDFWYPQAKKNGLKRKELKDRINY